jgi:putative glutamine amidotransferase
MAFPVIGVTTSNGIHLGHDTIILMRAYVEALMEAGGVPVLIPSGLTAESWRSLYERLDGILFSGGGDISIRRFGGQPHEKIRPADDTRDEIEFALVEAAVSDRKPFLGICRGFQVINVALGGTLYTHIKDQMPNALPHKYSSKTRRAYLAHAVDVAEGTRLADILGETKLSVNSMHHQGAKVIAAALKPVAYAPDGLVEAVELPDHPFGIAVQWHPECLPDQPVTRRLFRAFVDAADEYYER